MTHAYSQRRGIVIRKLCGMWMWHCSLCQPPAWGATVSFAKTQRNVARHCNTRFAHHRWVANGAKWKRDPTTVSDAPVHSAGRPR